MYDRELQEKKKAMAYNVTSRLFRLTTVAL